MSRTFADLAERVFDASPCPVIGVDLRGRIHLFSRAAEEILGYSAAEARDRLHVTDLYHRPDDARRVMAELRGANAGPRHTTDLVLRARDGELIPVRVTASLLHDAGGALAGTLGFFVDRREALAMDARLEEVAGQVIASERRAASVTSAADAAHELSQPLTAAMGHLEMVLEDDAVTGVLRDRVARAYGQLERIARIRAALTRNARGGRMG
jgi:PAS domain S-box-containing protein